MVTRRFLARLRRRVRRPSLGQLMLASVVLHLALLGLTDRMIDWTRPAPPPEPLIVELPPAEPGRPLVRPEIPSPPARPATRPPVVARPAPPSAPPREALPPAPPPAPSPEREPPAASTPPPQAVARAPEPQPEPLAPTPRVPEPSPPPPAPSPQPADPAPPPTPAPTPAPVPSPAARESAPPIVAAKPPVGEAPAPVRPSPPEAAPGATREVPFGDASRFSLLRPKIEVPSLPEMPSGGGGTRREGEGAGESGWERDGQAAIPLDTRDPRYTEYFVELKKRIEANWVYPQEAAHKGQSGHGLVGFVLRKDGSLREVEIVQSSGVTILDRYLVNAIRLAAPFPPVPDRLGRDGLPVAMTFRYILDGGVRLFGLQ